MANEGEADDKIEEHRVNLARYADNKKTRKLGWPCPCDWRPKTVENPESGMPFTDAGAWSFISALLKQGVPIEKITLKIPPGQEAYVMKYEIDPNRPVLYIKIHFGNGCVLGRSFHYSEQK